MEGLMELVNTSFARHGIECPASDSGLEWGSETRQTHVEGGALACPAEESSALARAAGNSLVAKQTAHGPDPIAFPEHNYRKRLQGDPAP